MVLGGRGVSFERGTPVTRGAGWQNHPEPFVLSPPRSDVPFQEMGALPVSPLVLGYLVKILFLLPGSQDQLLILCVFCAKSLESGCAPPELWYSITYRGTSLIRNSAPLGLYRSTMPRALWWF